MPRKSFILTMTIYTYDIQALAILQTVISQKLKLHNIQYVSLSWNIFCSFTEKPRIIEKVACVFFFVENKVYFNYLPWSLIYILSRLEMPRLFFKLRLRSAFQSCSSDRHRKINLLNKFSKISETSDFFYPMMIIVIESIDLFISFGTIFWDIILGWYFGMKIM